jgi:hypothetical protein
MNKLTRRSANKHGEVSEASAAPIVDSAPRDVAVTVSTATATDSCGFRDRDEVDEREPLTLLYSPLALDVKDIQSQNQPQPEGDAVSREIEDCKLGIAILHQILRSWAVTCNATDVELFATAIDNKRISSCVCHEDITCPCHFKDKNNVSDPSLPLRRELLRLLRSAPSFASSLMSAFGDLSTLVTSTAAVAPTEEAISISDKSLEVSTVVEGPVALATEETVHASLCTYTHMHEAQGSKGSSSLLSSMPLLEPLVAEENLEDHTNAKPLPASWTPAIADGGSGGADNNNTIDAIVTTFVQSLTHEAPETHPRTQETYPSTQEIHPSTQETHPPIQDATVLGSSRQTPSDTSRSIAVPTSPHAMKTRRVLVSAVSAVPAVPAVSMGEAPVRHLPASRHPSTSRAARTRSRITPLRRRRAPDPTAIRNTSADGAPGSIGMGIKQAIETLVKGKVRFCSNMDIRTWKEHMEVSPNAINMPDDVFVGPL